MMVEMNVEMETLIREKNVICEMKMDMLVAFVQANVCLSLSIHMDRNVRLLILHLYKSHKKFYRFGGE